MILWELSVNHSQAAAGSPTCDMSLDSRLDLYQNFNILLKVLTQNATLQGLSTSKRRDNRRREDTPPEKNPKQIGGTVGIETATSRKTEHSEVEKRQD